MRRGFPITKQMQVERRKRAEDRNAEYNKLSLDQKLAKLPAEPHAAKQRAQLKLRSQKGVEKAEAVQAASAIKAEQSKSKKGVTQ